MTEAQESFPFTRDDIELHVLDALHKLRDSVRGRIKHQRAKVEVLEAVYAAEAGPPPTLRVARSVLDGLAAQHAELTRLINQAHTYVHGPAEPAPTCADGQELPCPLHD